MAGLDHKRVSCLKSRDAHMVHTLTNKIRTTTKTKLNCLRLQLQKR